MSYQAWNHLEWQLSARAVDCATGDNRTELRLLAQKQVLLPGGIFPRDHSSSVEQDLNSLSGAENQLQLCQSFVRSMDTPLVTSSTFTWSCSILAWLARVISWTWGSTESS
jgi:hypothetical protein